MPVWSNQSKNSDSWSNASVSSSSWSNQSISFDNQELLAETGDYLLQETGDRILLESSVPGNTPWTNIPIT